MRPENTMGKAKGSPKGRWRRRNKKPSRERSKQKRNGIQAMQRRSKAKAHACQF
jgi:hypothetical protein